MTSLDLAPVAATTVGATPQPWTDWIGPVLIAGVVLRLLWIGIGCLRLERLRRRGELASDPLFDDIARAIGARAEIRYVPQLSQPVMFGVRRPVILLPERLRDAPADIRQAVAAHELWHVRRRDWLWLIGEELVRAGLWFQPVIWWLIARIRASREEVVDGLSIAVTGRRQSYLRALVAFADVSAAGRRRGIRVASSLVPTDCSDWPGGSHVVTTARRFAHPADVRRRAQRLVCRECVSADPAALARNRHPVRDRSSGPRCWPRPISPRRGAFMKSSPFTHPIRRRA